MFQRTVTYIYQLISFNYKFRFIFIKQICNPINVFTEFSFVSNPPAFVVLVNVQLTLPKF